MPHAVVALGGSAGGIEGLRNVVSALPEDLDATILVVVHVPSNARSQLASILTRASPLPATPAQDGDPLVPGRILVAPPDRHLEVHGDRIALTRGPRENGHRPAIDVTFRTAAASLGPRLLGAVMSGTLDDGTLGLVEIKTRGGVTVAQDPETAQFPSMPMSAIAGDDVDHIASPFEIGVIIERFARGIGSGRRDEPAAATPDVATHPSDDPPGQLVSYTCPRCHGPLWEHEQRGAVSYRCRVGHAWNEHAFEQAQGQEVEESLWTAVRALREKASMAERLTQRATERGQSAVARAYDEHATEMREHARTLRQVVEGLVLTVPHEGAPPAVQASEPR